MSLLLAVDTSGKNGSLGLARCASGQAVEIVDVVPLAGGAFSAQLVPEIARLLERNGCSKSDLGAFVVVNGPGSFTGLRVGLAAIKALAEALQKPIMAISLLEAVALESIARGGRVLSVLDAGRGDFYVGDYEMGSGAGRARMRSERLLARDEFLAEAKVAVEEGIPVATVDAALAETLRASGLRVEQLEYPGGAVIARLGWERLQRGQTVRPEELEANYIRQSDAQIFSKPLAPSP
jgi:tRNA threonylcarbamoyladenosine biosynthesis protein TsaB